MRPNTAELTNELEKDLAFVMLIEKRHADRLGALEARDLIEKVKWALRRGPAESIEPMEQDLIDGFAVH